MTGDLIAFLRARLDEREAAALDVGDGSEVERFSTAGHDRDVARAIHNQARLRSGAISDVQVRHLLAIGHQRGQISQRGSAAVIAAQRRIVALVDGLPRDKYGNFVCRDPSDEALVDVLTALAEGYGITTEPSP